MLLCHGNIFTYCRTVKIKVRMSCFFVVLNLFLVDMQLMFLRKFRVLNSYVIPEFQRVSVHGDVVLDYSAYFHVFDGVFTLSWSCRLNSEHH
jgi:hypothetical protein